MCYALGFLSLLLTHQHSCLSYYSHFLTFRYLCFTHRFYFKYQFHHLIRVILSYLFTYHLHDIRNIFIFLSQKGQVYRNMMPCCWRMTPCGICSSRNLNYDLKKADKIFMNTLAQYAVAGCDMIDICPEKCKKKICWTFIFIYGSSVTMLNIYIDMVKRLVCPV